MYNAESLVKRLENAKNFLVATLPLMTTRVRSNEERDAVILTSYVFAVRPIVEAIEMIAEDQGLKLENIFDEENLAKMPLPVKQQAEIDFMIEKINISISFLRDPFLYDTREVFRESAKQGLVKAIYLLTSVVEAFSYKKPLGI